MLETIAVGCAAASATPLIAAACKPAPAHSALCLPAHACDCHSHVIGPYNRYPMVSSRVYTPPMASVGELRSIHAKLGIERSVLVQPSFYGTDNSCLMDALSELGSAAKGIAVISSNPSSIEIDRLRAAGIVGIRINQTGGIKEMPVLKRVLERSAKQAAELGWHVQAFFPLKIISSLADVIRASPAPFVLDHFAGADSTGLDQDGMRSVLEMLIEGNTYVKLSAMYHVSAPSEYPGMRELATAFLNANPHRVLWATDWPHTDSRKVTGRDRDDISPFYPVDDRNLLANFFAWVPDGATRRIILVDNPARLFKFAE
ncbi:amidohydrolase family protein [Paraburkholderia sp. Tr-20389]|uniref:amidohydrolase family protein n=1 Tax=Paraburkholderia sp. Tr-20389 TaxID=2703903 RepID=UPI002402B0E4|nr:amidohydrolase family protein [Paraburkholderia sp. Tr-20389]